MKVFVGTSKRFYLCEQMIKNSINRNTKGPVDLIFISPESLNLPETGCTGFTNLRYIVPHLSSGFAVYLDVDMIVLGDLFDLYSYRQKGGWSVICDGSDEVAVIDCDANKHMPQNVCDYHKSELKPMAVQTPIIPLSWNSKDKVESDTKILHFTDLKHQPWFAEHPNKEAVKIYENYR